MAEIVELVPKKAIQKTVEVRRNSSPARSGYRVVELARRQQKKSGRTQESRSADAGKDHQAGAEIIPQREGVEQPLDPSARLIENEPSEETEHGPHVVVTVKPQSSAGAEIDLLQTGPGAGSAPGSEPFPLLTGQDFPETESVGKEGGQKEGTSSETRIGDCSSGLPHPIGECLRIYEIDPGAVIVFWRLGTIDDWTAPALGAVCKELLTLGWVKKIFFDFSAVEEMSTAAIGTLVRFHNTIVHLEKEMALVVTGKLKSELERAWISRVFDLRENLYSLVGSEIEFVEKTAPRGSQRQDGWFARLRGFCRQALFGRPAGRLLLCMVLICLMQIGVVIGQKEPFPTLAELEQMLAEAPDLRSIEVELQRQKLEQGWGNHIIVYGNYSQYFPSVAPLFPLDEFGLAGGTTVGISVSIPLDRFLGKKTPADLDRQIKSLEYDSLFQQKLTALRVLYRQRLKLLAHLRHLAAQKRTVDLHLEKVRTGVELVPTDLANNTNLDGRLPFVFDAIDVADAEERVAGIESEIRQAELDVESVEAEIMGLLGKGRVQQ